MRRFKLVAITLAIAIMLSPVSVRPSGASGPMYKIYSLGESIRIDYLRTLGIDVVEEYETFVLGHMDPSLESVLSANKFQAVPYPNWDTVRVGRYTLKAGEHKLLMPQSDYPPELSWTPIQPTESDYFVIQFRGPVKDVWTKTLESHGALRVSTLPENAVVVYMNFDKVRIFSEFEYVLGVSPYHPAFKIANGIQADSEGYAKVLINIFSNTSPFEVASTLPISVEYDTKNLDSGAIVGKCKMVNLATIARHPSVMQIEPYIEPTIEMDYTRQILGIEKRTAPISDYTGLPATTQGVWDKGLKGSGEIVAVQDTGLDSGNLSTLFTDFGVPPRVVGHFGYSRTGPANPPIPAGPDPNQTKPWNDTHMHGTFTTGQVAGDGRNQAGNTYAGIAPEAGIVVQAGLGWLNPGLGDSYKLGARVHSNSWGSPINVYNASAQYLDRFVFQYPDMVVAVSAGNSGPSASTLGTPSTAKNDICVGASGNNKPQTTLTVAAAAGNNTVTVASTANFGANQRVRVIGNTPAQDEFRTIQTILGGPPRIRFTQTLTFAHNVGNIIYTQHPNSLANFSSRGPTSDNRIKPDLVAPGSLVMGVLLQRPPNYTLAQGTSMSCPSLAGSAALTRQWLRTYEARPKPSAALIKGLFINGARPIVEDYNGTAIQYYPNNLAGWGEVDLYTTLFPTAPTVRKYYDVKNGILTGQRLDFPIVAGTGRFKATLVWSDYEGNPSASPYLVNDLDLIVTNPSNSTFYAGNQFITNSNDSTANPASRDNLNNVEGIFQANLTQAGVYTVSVQGSNILNGPQPFALIVEYQQTLPDFDIRVYPDTLTVDTNFNCGQYKVQLKSLAGFSGDIHLDFTEIAPEFTAEFQTNPVWLANGSTLEVYFTLCKKTPLKLGKSYFKVRGKFGDIYHEDTLEVIVKPSSTYRFNFVKGVQVGGGMGTFGDNGKQVSPGQRISYALNYDKNELNTFTNLYIDDIIPKSVTYNGNAFPLPTHYSTDNGATWINTKAPPQAQNPIILRWQLDQIIGSGRMTKPSTGVPGFDNVSNNTGSSHGPKSVIDDLGNIHIVWSDDTTGNPDDTEVFYTKFDKAESRWENLLGNPGFSNISNDASSFDENPDISVDSSGMPHFIWSYYRASGAWWPPTIYQIRYSRWNGTHLVTANGTNGSENLAQPTGDQYSQYMMPRVKTFGTNATVVFVNYSRWIDTQGIYLTRWNGASWVRMNNTVGLDKIVNNGMTYRPSGISLGLDLTGNPHVVYTREQILMWWSFPNGMHASKWTPSLGAWTFFDSVTPGWQNVFPTPSMNQYYPDLKMNGNQPHLVWADLVTRRWINYTKHNGTTWVDSNNNPGFFRVSNSTVYDDNLPCLTLQTNGQPAVGFVRVITNVPQFLFRWLRPSGWTDLLEINPYENITEGLRDSRYPTILFDSTNKPYFTFQSAYSGSDEVYCTTPTFGWTTNNYPGQIVWEGKIDDRLASGVTAITNKAYMSGKIDTIEYQVETVKTESITVNPFAAFMVIRKTASSSEAKVGQEIKYTIKITNSGNIPIEGIVINDILPNGLKYVRSLPSGLLSLNKVVWRIATLGIGQSTSVDIWCRVDDADYAGKIIVNDAIVTNDSSIPTAKTSSSVKILSKTSGFPKTDYSIKLLTKQPKAGENVQLEIRVWSSNPPLTYIIEWGDGTTQSGNLDPNKPLILEHTYSTSGDYKARFKVYDRYNSETVSELNVKVK